MALLMEYVTFDFSVLDEPLEVSSLADFLTVLDGSDFHGFEHVNRFIACDVCAGLTYLHNNGIVHRDLKPANILVSNQHYSQLGEDGLAKYWQSRPVVAKLTDFGESRARLVQTASLQVTRTSNIARGTPVFMAPEAFDSNRLPSASIEDFKRMDVWSFGMVLFTLLNADVRHPYELELKENPASSQQMAQAVLRRLMVRKQLPRHSIKYEDNRKNLWSDIMRVHESCLQFIDRPSMEKVTEMLQSVDSG
jgi:serine/threonine protein kinase